MLTDMFDYLLKKYLFLFDSFNRIGKVSQLSQSGMPVGILYYLDFDLDYEDRRPVTPKIS